MSYLIKEMVEDERPRERFKNYGVEALSNTELLSILMRCGTRSKSVMELSSDLLKLFNINDFSNINYNVLKDIKGCDCQKETTKKIAKNKKRLKEIEEQEKSVKDDTDDTIKKTTSTI